MSEVSGKPLDEQYRESRAGLVNAIFAGLLTINGGGAVAAGALLRSAELRRPLAFAVAMFVLGLVLAFAFQYFRYRHSHLAEVSDRLRRSPADLNTQSRLEANEAERLRFYRNYWRCVAASLVCFAVGVLGAATCLVLR